MLAAGLPHVDAWNTWFEQYDNEPARFAELNARVDAAAERAGRDPREISRSACLLVSVGDPGVDERLSVERLPAVPVERLDDALSELGEGGADEAILVAVPITEASARSLGAALPR
jgi:alkanesulfonate monooxygenase SsuD/methylene tetrahydromethanopterin reductase-like flavin-dependent oxidoreductase (luciferase family)